MRDISVSFAATGAIQVVNIATGLLAARLLLPEGRGELAAIMLWPGILAEIGILGLSDALLYHAAKGGAAPRQLFASAAWPLAILSVLLIGIGIAIVPLVHHDDAPAVQAIATWYTSYIAIYYAGILAFAMFQGQLDLMAWNWLRTLVPLGYLLFILLLVMMRGATVEDFAAANLATHLIAAAVGLWVMAKRGWLGLRPRRDLMRSLIIYGAKVHVGEVLNSLRQRLDQALVALLLPSADLGLYVVALTMANAPMFLVATIANVAFPKMSQQGTAGGRTEVFGRYLRLALLIAALIAVGLLAVAHLVLPLLFGQAFRPAVPILQVLLLGLPAHALKIMLMQALKAWDRSLVIGRSELAGVAVAAPAMLILMPRLGILGAAMAVVAAQYVAALWMGASLRRELAMGFRQLLRPTPGDWQPALAELRRRLGRSPP